MVVFVGPDESGLVEALEDEGASVHQISGRATRPSLEEAGIHDADILVLTDTAQATAVPIARDLNSDLKTVLYSGSGLPVFLAASEVLTIDPAIFAPSVVAEELLTSE